MPLAIRSAASPYCGNSRRLLAAALVSGAVWAQLATGDVEGTLHAPDGRAVAGASILVHGENGFQTAVSSDSNGEFTLTLPYGRYRMSVDAQGGAGTVVDVGPLQTTHVDLSAGKSLSSPPPGVWADSSRGGEYPEAFSLAGNLLSREPSSVTEPLDFTGLHDNRLAVESQRGFSWTDTQFKLQGMDATDSYQPGRPAVLPDIQSLDEAVVRSAFAQTASSSPGTEIGLFLAQPGASWHGGLSSDNTGTPLSSTNLPAPAERGLVQQNGQFRRFTRDRLEIGGPLTKRADFYASSAGQWASQTEPLAAPGTDQRSRLLFANARGRFRAGAHDQFDALYSGSRIDLSNGGVPAGLEALTSDRLAPSFVLPGGFPGDPETDHLDFVQVGWTHVSRAGSGSGVLEVRYGWSTAHLDTSTPAVGQSRVELLGGAVSGPPPLANLAVRPRQGIEVAWQPSVLRALGTRHRIVAGGGWKTSGPINRFNTPSGMNWITANGAPAFVTEFNTPLDSRELVRSLSSFVADHVSVTPSFSLDAGVFADFSRGSVPAQSSPAGFFAPVREFAAQPDLIVWNSLSPRAGFAWRVPRSHGLVLRGTFFRLYSPLAARYLDFGNPNSLAGTVYSWTAANSPGGALLRFGGPYSSISPSLHRPYSDEFDIGAEYPLARRTAVSATLFRRDDRNRLAAIDAGVPAQAFTPVSIPDPGPGGILGAPGGQLLGVYAQNPATLGRDQYLLTNPSGLRTLDTGVTAEARTEWRRLTLHASFVAEKSFGPTNPGDAFYENDPGVLGALFLDPNSAIHSTGRSFVDRAYVGKIQGVYRLPSAWGGIEVASVADYLDGLPFARQLLVTGLPQGPFLVATTARGSPGGGNRAEHVLNWSLRLSRDFELPFGTIGLSADVFNLIDAAQRLQEEDLGGPSFNLRLPVAIQPARFVRIGFRYRF